MKSRSIGFNTMSQALSKGVVTACGLVVLLLLTRGLGKEGFGAYSTVYAWLGITITLSEFGLQMVATKEFSRPDADIERLLPVTWVAKSIFLAGTLLISIIFLVFTPYGAQLKTALAASLLALIGLTATDPFKSLLQSQRRLHLVALSESMGSMAVLAAVLLVPLEGKHGVLWAILALGVGSAARLSVLGRFCRKAAPTFKPLDKELLRKFLARCLPLGISGILAVLVFRVDVLMLSWMQPMDAVGQYGAAYRIIEVVLMLPMLFLASVFPLLSLYADDARRMSGIHELARKVIAAVIVPVAVCGQVAAPGLCALIGGDAFVLSEPLYVPLIGWRIDFPMHLSFRILLLAACLMAWGQLNGMVFIARNREKLLLYAYFFLVPANIVLNLVLIPVLSHVGASLATLLTEVVAVSYTMYHMQRLGFRYPLSDLILPLLLALPTAWGIYLLNMYVVWEILLAVGVYGVIFSCLSPGFIRQFMRNEP